MKSCYSNEVHTVGIAGPSSELVSSFWSHDQQAVILIDEISRAITTPSPVKQETRNKLQNFVVIATSTTSLKQTLRDIKNSTWWNHMASFLIIDSPTPLNHGCSKAFEILSTAWKTNLLHAKFICHHESKGPLIYSYNPYTNQAPLPWHLEKTFRIKNKHPWTLLVRSYQNNQEICKHIDFDKTKDLGGYEIRAAIYSTSTDPQPSEPNVENLNGFNGISARYLFRALNSTSKVIVYKPSIEISNIMVRGVTDIHLTMWPQWNNFNSSMTYPHALTGLSSITQRRGNLSQIGKLLRVIDIPSRYAVAIVCFVTFVFFKFILRQPVTLGFLTIVRLICNAAVPNLPSNVPTRIYMSGLLLFMLTLQGIYQGKLASLLTKQVALPNIDTLEDLENFNYTVYIYKSYKPNIETLNFSGHIVPHEDASCMEYVLRDDGAACVMGSLYAVDLADKLNLYQSNDWLITSYLVYIIRDDWPIEERLNAVISRLFEAHIIEYVRMKKPALKIAKLKYHEKEKDDQKFQVIHLKELAFAFVILGIGLAFSTVVFIIEMFVE